MSDSDIKEKEFNPEEAEKIDGGLSPKEQAALDQIGAGLRDSNDEIPFRNEEDKKGGRSFITRKKAISGGVVGLVIAAIFGGFTVMSGPLQFIHIAQLLKGFHFSTQENASDDRMSKIARYIRYGKDHPEKTRMNRLGNLYADRIEAKFNKAGIESSYSKVGYGDGYIIDPAKLATESEITEFRDKSPEEIKKHFKENFDIDLVEREGKFFASSEKLGYFKNRKLLKSMMEIADLDGILGPARARIMTKRSGSTLHPIKKLDRKLLESVDARFRKWRQERQQRLDNGDSSATTRQDTEDEDKDGKPDEPTEESTQAKAETDEIIDEAKKAGEEIKGGSVTPDGPLAKFRASTGLKLAGGASAAIGIVCLAKGIADNIDNARYLKVVLPLMRLGMETIAVGNQVMSNQDIDLEKLGFYVRQLYGATTPGEAKTSWAAGRSIQAEEGKELTGPDIRGEAKIKDNENVVSQFVNSIPGVGGVCKAANSIIGQAISFSIDVLGGPVSAIAGQGFGLFLAPHLIEGLTNWFTGHPIDLTHIAGADYGNYFNYGARLAANDSYIAAGGVKLSNSQVAALKLKQMESQQEDKAEKSFAQRMFDPYDSDSLVAQIMDRQNPDVGANVANTVRNFANITTLFTAPVKTFSTLFSGKASAAASASNYDYGFSLYGFSMDELNNDATKNPFENADLTYNILNGSKGDEFIKRSKECFGIALSKDGNTVKSEGGPPAYSKMPDSCTDTDPEWLRVRFYVFDTQVMESAACYEGDDTSCSDIGFGNSTATNQSSSNTAVPGDGFRGVDTSSQSCPSGSSDLGVKQVPTGENLPASVPQHNIRLCGIPEIPGGMNVAIVGNVISLIAAARGAGVELAGSSFRTTQSQIDLRIAHCGSSEYAIYEAPSDSCSPATAKPGTSMHEQGLAIDFNNCGSGSACFNWLSGNAATYGLKNLPAESWHWSTTGN